MAPEQCKQEQICSMPELLEIITACSKLYDVNGVLNEAMPSDTRRSSRDCLVDICLMLY